MYMDTYVAAGIIIVALTCVVAGYVSWYGYRHVKKEIAEAEKKEQAS